MTRWMCGGLVAVWLTGTAVAEPAPKPPRIEKDCRPSGPPPVACYARPTDTKQYIGYYVGGGCAMGGRHRTADEGTWGWDYQGCLPFRKIMLRWCCKHQGGLGAYATTGPNCPAASSP